MGQMPCSVFGRFATWLHAHFRGCQAKSDLCFLPPEWAIGQPGAMEKNRAIFAWTKRLFVRHKAFNGRSVNGVVLSLGHSQHQDDKHFVFH